jgi:hypothetical protein
MEIPAVSSFCPFRSRASARRWPAAQSETFGILADPGRMDCHLDHESVSLPMDVRFRFGSLNRLR